MALLETMIQFHNSRKAEFETWYLTNIFAFQCTCGIWLNFYGFQWHNTEYRWWALLNCIHIAIPCSLLHAGKWTIYSNLQKVEIIQKKKTKPSILALVSSFQGVSLYLKNYLNECVNTSSVYHFHLQNLLYKQ